MVEFSPATREARVRFPDVAIFCWRDLALSLVDSLFSFQFSNFNIQICTRSSDPDISCVQTTYVETHLIVVVYRVCSKSVKTCFSRHQVIMQLTLQPDHFSNHRVHWTITFWYPVFIWISAIRYEKYYSCINYIQKNHDVMSQPYRQFFSIIITLFKASRWHDGSNIFCWGIYRFLDSNVLITLWYMDHIIWYTP